MAGERSSGQPRGSDAWPALPLDQWQDTYATLHRWAQIVGKVRLARLPWINHSWHVTLYVTARGLTTGPMPCGGKSLQIDFDFIDHRLNELEDATPFPDDETHATYDGDAARRCWRVLVNAERVLTAFRARFL